MLNFSESPKGRMKIFRKNISNLTDNSIFEDQSTSFKVRDNSVTDRPPQ